SGMSWFGEPFAVISARRGADHGLEVVFDLAGAVLAEVLAVLRLHPLHVRFGRPPHLFELPVRGVAAGLDQALEQARLLRVPGSFLRGQRAHRRPLGGYLRPPPGAAVSSGRRPPGWPRPACAADPPMPGLSSMLAGLPPAPRRRGELPGLPPAPLPAAAGRPA